VGGVTHDLAACGSARHRLVAAEQVLHRAVAMAVRGQRALKATPSRNSSAMPSTHMLMPYLAMV
jgi:hypothetical protein